ncbi:MAG: hypothetical protein M0Q43_10345 [Methanothrix sp.]|jgi:hypothetical protein|nr:hypothetical protein [Methanothrix sp.]
MTRLILASLIAPKGYVVVPEDRVVPEGYKRVRIATGWHRKKKALPIEEAVEIVGEVSDENRA